MADSYNELFGLGSHSPDANLEGWWPLMDNAASTTVLDYSGKGNNGATGGTNTSSMTTSGPNSYLTSALDFDNTSSRSVQGSGAAGQAASGISFGLWSKLAATADNRLMQLANTTLPSLYYLLVAVPSRGWEYQVRNINGAFDSTNFAVANGGTLDTNWGHLSVVSESASLHKIYRNGSLINTDTHSSDAGVLTHWAIGGERDAIPAYSDADIAGAYQFSRAISLSEHQEIYAGPELINTVAPALSGTETVGQTLSSTTGTWALDAPFSGGSNGTASYSYQWTRSDDGSGTGEANISGATSSTYTLQSADAGKFIRCFVRATNDGGFDPAADTATAFTGAISGGGNRRRRLLICGART